jgi:2-dehydro-3-deoxyphosphooctonate aldolase (KDO 8-P synthase)
MQSSFFRNTPFKIIDRQIVDNNFQLEENDDIINVYDFSSWKLSPSNCQTPITSLSFYEQKLIELKEKHTKAFGLCITSPLEVQMAAKYAKFLYIPGEFCRQSDVLESAKNSKLPLVVEKGIFLAPNDIQRLCEKIHGADFALVDCGSTNGYSDSILDPRSLLLICARRNSLYS